MCGIVGAFELKTDASEVRDRVLNMAKKLRHRGPDWSGIYQSKEAILAHERLAIVDPVSGGQPLYSSDKKLILAANGEIYNHRKLRKNLTLDYEFQTKSDCEVILALYKKFGSDFIDQLNGMFAFALYDSESKSYLIARDHMGIIPLYQGWDEHGNYYVASELKSLEGVCHKIETFPPGHYLDSKNGELIKWYKRDWESYDHVEKNASKPEELRSALENAVKRQLMSDVPYGVLLSGGLDSSLLNVSRLMILKQLGILFYIVLPSA